MKCYLVLIFLFFSGWLSAQNYYVVSVEGEIFDGETVLAPKHKLTADTELRFASAAATAYVLSPKKGYFVLTPTKGASSRGSEFLIAVKNALIPPSQLKETAIRGLIPQETGVLLEDPYDLLDFFRGKIAYADTLFFRLNPEEFSVEGGVFNLHYRVDQKTTSYPYTASDNVLALHLPPGLLQEEKPVELTFSYDPLFSENDDFEPEAFTFIQISEKVLRQELGYLRSLQPDVPLADFLNKVALPHVEIRYGKVSVGWVRKLLE